MSWLIDPHLNEPDGSEGSTPLSVLDAHPGGSCSSGSSCSSGTCLVPDAGDDAEDPSVSRRSFLRLLGIGAGAAAAVGAGVELLTYREYAAGAAAANGTTKGGAVSGGAAASMADPSAPPTHQWAMVIDLRSCNGCKSCTAACQKAHSLTQEQTWIDVFTMTSSTGKEFPFPRPCMQCENPPCLHVCPVHATYRQDQGVVLVNETRCIGCRMCMAACPYQARYFNWNSGTKYPDTGMPQDAQFPVPQRLGTVGKCTFCVGNLNNGLMSECAAGCPMGAIYNADIITDVAVNSMGNTVKLSKFLNDNDAVTFKPEQNTHPRVWYILGHGQDLDADVSQDTSSAAS
ncbi:MAG: 4Fe-4S dicluster domain-containing protein [Actinomycetota bacterium]|nr:4Fe-4S dicluster domain-containing protein [Actinomycetota bacterium]